MFFQIRSLLLLMSFLALVTACRKSPKVVTATTGEKAVPQSSGIFSGEPSTATDNPGMDNKQSFSDDLHTVTVNEVLPTSKYVYLNVSEGSETYWIASRKQEVKKGEKYYYRNGLLKTNFESKEYNRIFERVYLVSNLVPENHGMNLSPTTDNQPTPGQTVVENLINSGADGSSQAIERAGSVKIADLVNNPDKYEGKRVQVSGKCVKINPNIMNRNWIHLQDGSKDDFDLVVTSNDYVHEEQVITMQAVVSLDRDFGAGYKYQLILEDGVIVP